MISNGIQIRLAALLLAVAPMVAACSGGEHAIPAQAPASYGNVQGAATSHARRGTAALTMRIAVPKKPRRPATVRVYRKGRPAFVSPSTKGMTISLAGPTDVTTTVGLTLGSSGCTSTLASVVCTLTIPGLQACGSPAKCYTATIKTFDGIACAAKCSIPPGANELSAAQNVTFTVVAGQSNTVGLTLAGIPKTITVTPRFAGYIQGDAGGLRLWGSHGQQIVVASLDSDGNTIVGAGAPTMTASVSSPTLAVAAVSGAGPNLFVITAATSGSPPVVTPGTIGVSFTATPAAESGASTLSRAVPVTIAHSTIYVATSNNDILTFVDGNAGTPNGVIAGTNTSINTPGHICINAAGTIYVSSYHGNAVLAFAPGASGNVAPAQTISGASTTLNDPDGIALAPDGSIVVANFGSNSTGMFAATANGNTAPASAISGGSTTLSLPTGIAEDVEGTLYVLNAGSSSLAEYPAGSIGNAAPSVTISGNALVSPNAVSIDNGGHIFVSTESNTVVEYAAGASGNATPIATIAGAATQLDAPNDIAIDAAGNAFVANYDGNITEFAPGANGNVAPIGSFSTGSFGGNTAIAVVPASLPL
jgi:hypothetical protein